MREKKNFVKNIYYMLSYAFKELRLENYRNLATEDFDNIHNLFAAILVNGIGWQLKHGLYREYENRTEDMALVRGRIVMPQTIHNILARKRTITCEYDELTENNLLNRILKTTVVLLLRSEDVDIKFKESLKQEILFFSDVNSIAEPEAIRWSSIRFYRGNRTYQVLIAICQLVIEGLLLTTEIGKYRLAHFIDSRKIETLYEKFILEFYKKECKQVVVRAPQVDWALDPMNETKELLPKMQTDIVLSHGDKILIIDAKFKFKTTQVNQYGSHSLHSNNLYQIFSYVKNEACNTTNHVYGMLLYAATDDGIMLNHKYQMSGNQIWVKTLDLYRDFKDISQDLKQIVIDHFGEHK